MMQVYLEMLDKFLEKLTIPKAYKDLVNIFLLFNTNILLLYQDKNHVIELELGKTLLFNLLYKLLK